MKTRGTANLHLLTDDELRSMIGATALEIYEAHVFFGNDEIDFAVGTFEKFAEERKRRAGTSTTTNKVGFLG